VEAAIRQQTIRIVGEYFQILQCTAVGNWYI